MTTRNEPPWAAFIGEWRRTPASDPELRVSDAERAEIADALSRHYADGRLDQAEFDERLDKAMKAKTRSDFAPLLADLPRIVDDEEAPAPPHRPRRGLGLALVVAVVLLAANSAAALFRPSVPWFLVAIVAVVLVSRRRCHRCWRVPVVRSGST